MPAPQLWLVAGPNGAGKSTLVQVHPLSLLLPEVHFFNPDDRARDLLLKRGYDGFSAAPGEMRDQAFLAAAVQVGAELERALLRGEPVGVETVLSSDKYRRQVEFVQRQGGFCGLIYVALVSPELACRRVARRVAAGGHDVPAEKIAARWQRSLDQLPWFASRASIFWVFDNSDENPAVPPHLVARGESGNLLLHEKSFPALDSALRKMAAERPEKGT